MHTLFQGKMDHHNQEDGSRETQKIGPVLEVTTSCLHGKYGVEIRIWSLDKDKTHSWVRVSHGSSKFVMDSNSIINSGLIPGGQSSSKRQTVFFFLPIDPTDKEHKDPEKIDLNVPRRAQYLHNAWKRTSRRGILV